jgi:hypothetical protein
MNREFIKWFEMEIYLAGRDCASCRYNALKEVYEKLFKKEFNFVEIEKKLLTKNPA